MGRPRPAPSPGRRRTRVGARPCRPGATFALPSVSKNEQRRAAVAKESSPPVLAPPRARSPAAGASPPGQAGEAAPRMNERPRRRQQQLGLGAAERDHCDPVAPNVAVGQQQFHGALGLGESVQRPASPTRRPRRPSCSRAARESAAHGSRRFEPGKPSRHDADSRRRIACHGAAGAQGSPAGRAARRRAARRVSNRSGRPRTAGAGARHRCGPPRSRASCDWPCRPRSRPARPWAAVTDAASRHALAQGLVARRRVERLAVLRRGRCGVSRQRVRIVALRGRARVPRQRTPRRAARRARVAQHESSRQRGIHGKKPRAVPRARPRCRRRATPAKVRAARRCPAPARPRTTPSGSRPFASTCGNSARARSDASRKPARQPPPHPLAGANPRAADRWPSRSADFRAG